MLRKNREPATPEVPEAVQSGLSADEMAAAYARNVADATALVFHHLSAHPDDAGLDLERNGAAPTLYQAVAAGHPVIHDLGLTPTMWSRAVSTALNAVREQQEVSLAASPLPPSYR